MKTKLSKILLKQVIKHFKTQSHYKTFVQINKKCQEVLLLFTENPISLKPSQKDLFPNITVQNVFTEDDILLSGMKKYIFHFPVSYSFSQEMKEKQIQFKRIIYTLKDRLQLKGKIPDGVTEIGYKCFINDQIQEIILPESVKRIQNNAFENCYCLKKIHLSQKLIEIGAEAFINCCNLIEINQPTQLSFLGYNCFKNCLRLNELLVIYDDC